MSSCVHASPLPEAASSSCGDCVTAVWRLVDGQQDPTPIPADTGRPSGRSFHTLTEITATDDTGAAAEHFLLLFGGRGSRDLSPDVAWLYSTSRDCWAPLSVMSAASSSYDRRTAASAPLLPLSEIAPRAYHTATATTKGTTVWILGGKTGLDGSADSVSPDLLRMRLAVVRGRRECYAEGDQRWMMRAASAHASSSLDAFGVEAVVDQVLDAPTSVGPRAYHGCVTVEEEATAGGRALFAVHGDGTDEGDEQPPEAPPALVAYGGSSASHVIDAVSVFDTERLEWQHTFAVPKHDADASLAKDSSRRRAAGSHSGISLADDSAAPRASVGTALSRCASPDATPPRQNRSCLQQATGPATVRDESGGRGGSDARAASLDLPASPTIAAPATIDDDDDDPPALNARSRAVACAACGAPRGCVHTSRRLAGLFSCEGPQLLSASTLGTSARFTTLGGAAATDENRTARRTAMTSSSLPPRDAAVVWAAQAHPSGSSLARSARLHVLNGEVCTAFFNSAYTIDVRATPAGAIQASWRADVVSQHDDDNDDDDSATAVHNHHQQAPIAYQCAWPLGGRCIAAWGGFSMNPTGASAADFHDGLQVFDTLARRFRPCAVQLAAGTARPPSKRASAAASAIAHVRGAEGGGPGLHIGAAFVFGGDDGTTYFDALWRCDVYDAPHGPAAARRTLRSMCEVFLDGRR